MTPSLARDLVILASAVSAGVHAALAAGHFTESAVAGIAFLVAAGLLAIVAAALTRRRAADRRIVALAGATFAGLVASYGLATTSGLPLVHPEPEALDALGVTTKAFEVVGLLAAATLLRRSGRPVAVRPPRAGSHDALGAAVRPVPLFLTALVAVFSALVALAAAGGHDGHGERELHAHPAATAAADPAALAGTTTGAAGAPGRRDST